MPITGKSKISARIRGLYLPRWLTKRLFLLSVYAIFALFRPLFRLLLHALAFARLFRHTPPNFDHPAGG